MKEEFTNFITQIANWNLNVCVFNNAISELCVVFHRHSGGRELETPERRSTMLVQEAECPFRMSRSGCFIQNSSLDRPIQNTSLTESKMLVNCSTWKAACQNSEEPFTGWTTHEYNTRMVLIEYNTMYIVQCTACTSIYQAAEWWFKPPNATPSRAIWFGMRL